MFLLCIPVFQTRIAVHCLRLPPTSIHVHADVHAKFKLKLLPFFSTHPNCESSLPANTKWNLPSACYVIYLALPALPRLGILPVT